MPAHGKHLVDALVARWEWPDGECAAKSTEHYSKFRRQHYEQAVAAIFPAGLPEKHPIEDTARALYRHWHDKAAALFGTGKFAERHEAENLAVEVITVLSRLAPPEIHDAVYADVVAWRSHD